MFDLAVAPELSDDAILVVARRRTKALRSFQIAHATPGATTGELICTGLELSHEEGKKKVYAQNMCIYIYIHAYIGYMI